MHASWPCNRTLLHSPRITEGRPNGECRSLSSSGVIIPKKQGTQCLNGRQVLVSRLDGETTRLEQLLLY